MRGIRVMTGFIFDSSSEASPASGARQRKVHPRPPNSGTLGLKFNWWRSDQNLGRSFLGLLRLRPNRSFLDLLWLWLNPGFLSLFRLEHHLISKFLQPLDEVFCALLFIQVLEVITTQFFVIHILFQ